MHGPIVFLPASKQPVRRTSVEANNRYKATGFKILLQGVVISNIQHVREQTGYAFAYLSLLIKLLMI